MSNVLNRMNSKVRSLFICMGGLAGLILFVLSAYWIAGAMVYDEKAIGFIKRLVYVISSPFANHFNQYTPIVMIIAVVVYEFIFFLLMVAVNKKSKNLIDSLKDEEKQRSSEEFENKESENTVFKEQVAFPQEICMDLMGKNYTVEQIAEMTKLLKYMKDVNVELLTKMFDVYMSAEDIRDYIELFYK